MLPMQPRIAALLLLATMLSDNGAPGQEVPARQRADSREVSPAARPLQDSRASAVSDPARSSIVPEDSSIAPEELLAGWIAGAIPTRYEKKDDWGKTTRITVGLETRRRGLRLRIRKKEKDVPHGIWKSYRVALRDAPHVPRVVVEKLRAVAPGRAAATIRVSAPLDAWARTRIYQRGVHLGTYTAEGNARVNVRLECELGVKLDTSMGWPALILDPIIRTARVDLHEFRLRRVSNADGPLVRELGHAVKHVIEDELEPHKLTRKLNRAIEKKRDRLRLDVTNLVADGWDDLVEVAVSAELP